MGMEGGYCCVYLPDGSASLAPTHNGQPIKDMLASLCEKRGFPLKDVIIYLHGKDKVSTQLLCLLHQSLLQIKKLLTCIVPRCKVILQQTE